MYCNFIIFQSDDEDKKRLSAYISRFEWQQERLIWIAFDKNKDNDACLFSLLPKDIILEIIKFFKTRLRLHPVSRTDYHDYDDQALNSKDDNSMQNNGKIEKFTESRQEEKQNINLQH